MTLQDKAAISIQAITARPEETEHNLETTAKLLAVYYQTLVQGGIPVSLAGDLTRELHTALFGPEEIIITGGYPQ